MKQRTLLQSARKAALVLLSAILVLGLMPAISQQTKTSSYAEETQPNATLVFASDYQEHDGWADPRVTFATIAGKIAAVHSSIDEVIFCGDYTNSGGYNYNCDASTDIAEIKATVSSTFGENTATSFIQGNHDSYNSSLMAADGPVYHDSYIVYYMNTQSANPWNQGSTSSASIVQRTATNLNTFLQERISANDKRPIFIVTHVPLHMTSRTSSKYNSGDNMYASYLFNVINEAATSLDIVFLYGHNHSHGWDSYLGGSTVYRGVGSTLAVPDCTNASGTTNYYTNETLNFTYMNAGFVGYNTGTTANDTLTSSVVQIYNDKLIIQRFSKDGAYSLVGAQGDYNTSSDGGIYNDANGFVSGGAAYSLANATNAPVTINLKNKNDGSSTNPEPGTDPEPSTNTWDVVTSADQITAGEYLITYAENGYVVLPYVATVTANSKTRVGLVTNSLVSVTTGATSLEQVDTAHAWTLEAMGDGWVLKASNGYLHLATSANYDASFVSAATDATVFDITVSGSNVVFSYNNSGNMMQYASSYGLTYGYDTSATTENFNLYKAPESGSGGTDPEQPTVTDPDPDVTFEGVNTPIHVGDTRSITVSVPNGTIQGVDWVCSDESIASIVGMGATVEVTLLKAGTVTLEADIAYTENQTSSSSYSPLDWLWNAFTAEAAEGDEVLHTKQIIILESEEVGSTTVRTFELVSTPVVGETYVIATTNGRTLTYDGTAFARVQGSVTTSGSKTVLVPDATLSSTSFWTVEANGSYRSLRNEGNGKYLAIGKESLSMQTNKQALSLSSQGNNQYKIKRSNEDYYLRYDSPTWVGTKSLSKSTNVYFFKVVEHTVTIKTGDGGDRVPTVVLLGDGTLQVSATVNTGTVTNYAWSSSNTDVATIAADGETPAKANISLQGVGDTTITLTATFSDGAVVTSSYNLEVVGAPEARIMKGQYDITEVMQRRYEVAANTTEQLTSKLVGFTNPTLTWESSNTDVLTVDANGLVTFTGKTGYARVTLKATEEKNGQTITSTKSVVYFVSNESKPSATNNDPSYPNEGSVRLDKTATGVSIDETGIAQIELSADGIPATKPIDVVVVIDMSSSMNFVIDGVTRVNVMNESLQLLVSDILADHADGTPNENRLALVAFNNYDYTAINDKTGRSSDNAGNFVDYSTGDETVSGFNYTGTGATHPVLTGAKTIANPFNTASDLSTIKSTIGTYITSAYCSSGTNYDLGLMTAYKILQQAKTSDENYNRDQVVVFMSDGAPFQYNYFRGYSGNGDANAGNHWMGWTSGGQSYDTLDRSIDIINDTYGRVFYNEAGQNWWAEALRGTGSKTVIDPYTDTSCSSIVGVNKTPTSYQKTIEGLGAKVYTVGFCMQTDAEVTEQNQREMLTNKVASNPSLAYFATDADSLKSVFKTISDSLVYAASECTMTDLMGEKVSMQMASFVNGKDEHGATTQIDLKPYVGEDGPYLEVGKWKLNDARNRVSGSYETVERITFATDSAGKLTAAYSSLNPSVNIYNSAERKIVGTYVDYDVVNEKLTAKVDFIPGTTQYTINYFVYLEGSQEGTLKGGVYDTNKSASFAYTNYLGNPMVKEFPVPFINWGEAMVVYEYYLVDDKGELIDRDGNPITGFQNRVVAYRNYVTVPLNASGEYSAIQLNGYDYIPNSGYVLYNKDASYYVHISSASNSVAYVSDTKSPQTTLLTQQVGYQSASFDYTTDDKATHYNYKVTGLTDYNATHVCFAVTKIGSNLDLQITKNNTEGALLSGAGFRVYSDEACTQPADVSIDIAGEQMLKDVTDETKLYTNSDGMITFYGLQPGNTYYLKEFRTPTGYDICTNVLKFTIDDSGKVQVVSGNTDTTWSLTANEKGLIKVTLTDQAVNLDLPLTSGVGIYGYMLVGLVLMGISTVYIARLRKQRR